MTVNGLPRAEAAVPVTTAAAAAAAATTLIVAARVMLKLWLLVLWRLLVLAGSSGDPA
jgi:hypothetical protein